MHAEIEKYLKELYPSDAQKIVKKITASIKNLTKLEPKYSNPFWYKNMNLYVIYPDAIQVKERSSFDGLIDHIPRVKELGCTAMHILPFLESPLRDKGFDVSDFLKVRKDLGTHHDLQRFCSAADEYGLRLFMDIVFNHVSEDHEWFKKAQRGEKKYQDYFIHTDKKPTFIRSYHKDSAVWAEYEMNGKKRSINIAFPEGAGEIPHWREGEDGLWYYHTYYPHQLDLNWKNPAVFLECAEIIMYWASYGFHFRLDAIPFIGKSAYKETDKDHEKTFAIIAALKAVAREINPECVLLVETYESLDTVLEYFGTSNREQAEMSYNFHLCTYLWVTLVTQDTDLFWKKWVEMQEIPHYGEWLNFLRNHDELSLAYLPDDLKDRVSEELLERGAPFREGFGISGRTYSLLGNSERRFLLAYFFLASLLGGMVFVYGDEIGKKNIPFTKLSIREKTDTRNINRGPLRKSEYQSPKARRIFRKMKMIISVRNEILSQYQNVIPQRLHKEKKGILAYSLTNGSSELIVLINLSNKKKRLSLSSEHHENVLQVNTVHLSETMIELGPFAGVWLQK
jgi:maltose alpha-D-glucosyltransferase/alpha-amylase